MSDEEFRQAVEQVRAAYLAAGIDTPERARVEIERLRAEDVGDLLLVEWLP